MNLSALIDRMISAGVPAGEAGAIAAEIYAAGVASVAAKSPAAVRQQRYRDRQSVTNRNETVTQRNAETAEPTVTNRNETVTNRNDVTPLSISIDKNSKKESRGSQLPDGWKPDDVRWIAACRKLGIAGAETELQKFTSHHRAKGTVFKNWSFGWDKWLLNAADWGPKQAASVVTEKMSMDDAVAQFARFGRWSRHSPVNDISQVPAEILTKHGLLSDGRKAAQQ